MGLMTAIVLAMLTILGAASAKVLADEFKAWAPAVVAKIIATAVQTLPAELRDRFAEEWHSHINEIPGDVSKILVASGFLLAAYRMTNGLLSIRKRMLDVGLVGILLLLLAPTIALAALLIKLDSPGPIIVGQSRIGRGGKLFKALLFRTTADGAVECAKSTRVGWWLRRSSIYAIPQLINVLVGDMSLVGPKPTSEEAKPAEKAKSFKPGLTGLWAFGINDVASPVGSSSLKLEAKILLAAFGAILLQKRDGDYSADDFERALRFGSLAVVFSIALASAVLLAMNAV